MKKAILTLITLASISLAANAQNVNIPDDNFKTALLANTEINTDANLSEISIAEAEAFTGKIEVIELNIEDLTGIEKFINLTKLKCQGNYLTSIDLSKNTNLTELDCQGNLLTSLDLIKNTNLTGLYCSNNELTSLDLKANTKLLNLNCSSNNIKTLDISKSPNITSLDCSSNLLYNLDLTNISAMMALITCNYNPNLTCITALDSQNKMFWIYDGSVSFNRVCEVKTSIEESKQASSKTIVNIYNLQGQPVNLNYKGLVIQIYSDGTSAKMIQE